MSKVVSYRLNAPEKERLERICRGTGRSMGDVIREMLRDPDLEKLLIDAEQQGYRRGMKEWFGKAYAPCCVCGKSMLKDFINNVTHRQIMLRAFEDWGHKSCLDEREKRRRRR